MFDEEPWKFLMKGQLYFIYLNMKVWQRMPLTISFC